MFVRGDGSAPWRGLRAKGSAARSLDLRGAYLRSVLDIAAAGGGVRHKGGDVSMCFDVEASGEGNNLHYFKGFKEGFYNVFAYAFIMLNIYTSHRGDFSRRPHEFYYGMQRVNYIPHFAT